MLIGAGTQYFLRRALRLSTATKLQSRRDTLSLPGNVLRLRAQQVLLFKSEIRNSSSMADNGVNEATGEAVQPVKSAKQLKKDAKKKEKMEKFQQKQAKLAEQVCVCVCECSDN